MRRRLALLAAAICAASALAVPASAGVVDIDPKGDDGPPEVCVWSNGVRASHYYIPLYIPRTCIKPFR